MLKKPVLGVALVLALLCVSTFGYWSSSRGTQTYFSVQDPIDPNDQTTLILFNPSADQTVSYQMYLPEETLTGQLAPLASLSHPISGTGRIMLQSGGELIAWNQVRNVADALEYGRDTQPFVSAQQANTGLLFPWFQAQAGEGQSGTISVLNTDSFTAAIVTSIYDAQTGTMTLGPFYDVPPLQHIQFPAMFSSTGPDAAKYTWVTSLNSAHLLGQYESPQSDHYRYWAHPTYGFTSITRLQEPPVVASASASASRSTLAFSSDHLLFQGHGVSSWYAFLERDPRLSFSGEVQGEVAQTGIPFSQALASAGNGVQVHFDAVTFFPDPSYRSGTLDLTCDNPNPIGLALYRGDGDAAAAPPAAPMTHRAVFPVNGSEPWHDQLANSVFVFNNRQDTDIHLAVGLLDQQGDLLAVHYPTLAPGTSEIPVDQFVQGQSEARIILFENGTFGDVLSLHLMVTGSGSGFSAAVVDYIAPTPAPGCSTIGLGPEAFNHWGSGYTLACTGQRPTILTLVEQVNQGHPPPYVE